MHAHPFGPDLGPGALPLPGQRSISRRGSGGRRGEDSNRRGCRDNRKPDGEDSGAPRILGRLFDDCCQRLTGVDLDDRRRRDDRTVIRTQQLGDVAAWFKITERESPKPIASDRLDDTPSARFTEADPSVGQRRVRPAHGRPLNDCRSGWPSDQHALTCRKCEKNDGSDHAQSSVSEKRPRGRGSRSFQTHMFERAHRRRC